MYSTPVKSRDDARNLDDSLSASEDGMMTPIRSLSGSFGAPRKATPSKPSHSANYRCFLEIANQDWPLERMSELETTLMAQVSAGRDINAQRRSTGDCALHALVSRSAPHVVQAFLSHGADPSIKNHMQRTALHNAVVNPNFKVTKMIWRQLQRSQLETLLSPDIKGLTPLHIALMSASIDVIGYLLFEAYQPQMKPPLAQVVDSHSRNLLHALFERSMGLNQHEKLQLIIAKLIEAGVDRFAKDDRHRTPLKALLASLGEISQTSQDFAIASDSLVLTMISGMSPKEVDRSIMLMFKNDVDQWREDWRPVQQVMQVPAYFPFLPLFISHCGLDSLAFVDSKGRSIWHFMANMGAQKNVVEYYSAMFPPTATSTPSFSPDSTIIPLPPVLPHLEHIRKLVSACFKALVTRTDVKQLIGLPTFDSDHQSPLHIAAKFNSVIALSEIYHVFGNESQLWRDTDGGTPLHVAVHFNTLFSLIQMHDSEWDLNPIDGKGRTPYALALEEKRRQCAALLKSWGAHTGVSDLVDTSHEHADSNGDLEPTSQAGESANARFSVSLATIPSLGDLSLDSPLDTYSRDVGTSTDEEDPENDDDDEVPEVPQDFAPRTISTNQLALVMQAAKVRDEESEVEKRKLEEQVEELKHKLEEKSGEAKQLEDALYVRPTLLEFQKAQERADRNQSLAANYKSKVSELTLKIAELTLSVDDAKRAVHSDASSVEGYKVSLADSETMIEMLTERAHEAEKRVSHAKEEIRSLSLKDDLILQLQRQLDDTREKLSEEEHAKLQAIESLRENEKVVKSLYAQIDVLTPIADQNDQDAKNQEKARIHDEMNKRNEAMALELETIRGHLQTTETLMKQSETRNTELQSTIDHLQEAMGQHEANAQDKSAIQELTSKLHASEAQCTTLQSQVQQLISKSESNANELQEVAERVKSANNAAFDVERKQLLNRLETAEFNAERMRHTNAQLESELKSHKRENETLTKSVDLLDHATSLLKSEEESRKRQVEKLEEELVETKSYLSELRQYKDSERAKDVFVLESVISTFQQEEQRWKDVIAKLQSELEHAKAEMANGKLDTTGDTPSLFLQAVDSLKSERERFVELFASIQALMEQKTRGIESATSTSAPLQESLLDEYKICAHDLQKDRDEQMQRMGKELDCFQTQLAQLLQHANSPQSTPSHNPTALESMQLELACAIQAIGAQFQTSQETLASQVQQLSKDVKATEVRNKDDSNQRSAKRDIDVTVSLPWTFAAPLAIITVLLTVLIFLQLGYTSSATYLS